MAAAAAAAAATAQAQEFFGTGQGFGLFPTTGLNLNSTNFTPFLSETAFLLTQIEAPIQAAAVLLAVMCVKVFLTNFYTGKLKRQAGMGPPEDVKPDAEPVTKEAIEKYERWSRICANDAENLPYGLLAGVFAGIVCTFSPGLQLQARQLQVAAFALYCFFRILHTYVYANGKQPARTIIYVLGLIWMWINLALAIFAVFTLDVNSFLISTGVGLTPLKAAM